VWRAGERRIKNIIVNATGAGERRTPNAFASTLDVGVPRIQSAAGSTLGSAFVVGVQRTPSAAVSVLVVDARASVATKSVTFPAMLSTSCSASRVVAAPTATEF
jgi:hypothetical protein